jgi:hypothetical protein
MTSLGGWAAIEPCISATRSVIVDGLVTSGLLPLALVGAPLSARPVASVEVVVVFRLVGVAW